MRAQSLGPFDHQQMIVAQVIKAQFGGVAWIIEAIEVDMRDLQPRFRWAIGLDDRESRARRFPRQTQRGEQPRASVVLPAPRPPDSATTSPGRASAASFAPSASVSDSSARII